MRLLLAFLLLFAAPAQAQQIPASLYTGQIKIAVTSTAVCLSNVWYQASLQIKAASGNTANGFVGGTTVTTTDDGTGNGFRITPGETWTGFVAKSSSVCVNGTAGDIFYYTGS